MITVLEAQEGDSATSLAGGREGGWSGYRLLGSLAGMGLSSQSRSQELRAHLRAQCISLQCQPCGAGLVRTSDYRQPWGEVHLGNGRAIGSRAASSPTGMYHTRAASWGPRSRAAGGGFQKVQKLQFCGFGHAQGKSQASQSGVLSEE